MENSIRCDRDPTFAWIAVAVDDWPSWKKGNLALGFAEVGSITAHGGGFFLSGAGIDERDGGFVARQGEESSRGGCCQVDGVEALSVERHNAVALLDGQFLVPHHTGYDFTVEGGRGDHFPVGKIDIGRCFSVVGEEIEGVAAEVDDDVAILEQARPDAGVVSAGGDGGDVAKIETGDFEMRHLDAVFECGRFDARCPHREGTHGGSLRAKSAAGFRQSGVVAHRGFVESMRSEVEHNGVDHRSVESHLDHRHVGIGQERRGVREIESQAVGEGGEDKGARGTAEFDDAHLHEVVTQDAVDAETLGGTALWPAHGGDVAEVDTADAKRVETCHAGGDSATVGVLSGLCLTEGEAGSLGKGVAHTTGGTGVEEETTAGAVDRDVDHEFAVLLHIGDDGAEMLRHAGGGKQGDEQEEKAEEAHKR